METNFVSVDRAAVLVPDPNNARSVLDVYQARRGDWVRLLIEFTLPPANQADPPKQYHEFLTGMISEIRDGSLVYTGPRQNQPPQGLSPRLVKIKLLSAPAFNHVHGLKYGDIVTVAPRQIVEHIPTKDSDFESYKHMLENALNPIPPAAGKRYWLRSGETAEVWTQLQDEAGAYFLGSVNGSDTQWHLDGRHRGGVEALDIVKDPSASEVIPAGTNVLRDGRIEVL